jgi:CheY-like chemotaxis protein
MKCWAEAGLAPAESPRATRPKVLVVDDEPLIGLLYHRHIEKAGFCLITASTAQEGLLIAQKEAPAVIIIDVILPQVDGLSLVRQLKAADATRNIPTIVFTAVTLKEYFETAREANQSGATIFLTKPISPDRLVSEMKRLVAP